MQTDSDPGHSDPIGDHMTGRARPPLLARALGIFTEVRDAEAPTALLMALIGFVLLMAYYCVKPVREALILAQPSGAEYKAYMAGASALILSIAVPVYSRFSRNMPRNWLITSVTLFFASNLIIFYGLGKALGSSLTLALGFYAWIAVFNMMIVAQFWAFANDLYREEAGKRLFPLIGLGASVGAVAGSGAAKVVVGKIGALGMMPLAAALLVCSVFLTQWVHWREVKHGPCARLRECGTKPIGGTMGEAFRDVFTRRYLLLIAIFSLVFTLVKTNGDYLLARIVKDHVARAVDAGSLAPHNVQDYIGTFFAGFQLKIDIASLAIQAFIVSRLVKFMGVRGAFFILPFIALGDAAIMMFIPALGAVTFGKSAESSVDYSLNNTLRGMLWLPTSRRAKYLAKQATDTFFVRTGDVISAGLVFVGIHAVGLSVRGFASVNALLVCVWLVLARSIVKEFVRLREEPNGDDLAVAGGGPPEKGIGTGAIGEEGTDGRAMAGETE